MDPLVKLSKNLGSEIDGSRYRSIVGALIFLVTCTRPDIAFAVSELSRFMSNPGRSHHATLNYLLGYLKKYPDLGITYRKEKDPEEANRLHAYVDAYYATDVDSWKSKTGWITFFCNGPLTWKSQLQKITSTSTTDSELIACAPLLKEVVSLLPTGETGFHSSATHSLS